MNTIMANTDLFETTTTQTRFDQETYLDSICVHSASQAHVPHLTKAPLRWSWACRALKQAPYQLIFDAVHPPRAGDVVLVEVGSIRNHTRVYTAENQRLRLYSGDLIVGVMGNRYATDAFEAEARTTDDLHLLTAGGMIGTVYSRHRESKAPTDVTFRGYLADQNGRRINLKEMLFNPLDLMPENLPPILFVVGTGMNSGKTTVTASLVKGLLQRGIRVAACKLTGSVSHRDLYEYRATSAHDVRDFSDYGFPSTYLCDESELLALFYTMMGDAAQANPDLIVVEIADGILQRETDMLLRSAKFQRYAAGLVLSAPCPLSAMHSVERMEKMGHNVVAISGIITNAPLFVREFNAQKDTPIVSAVGGGNELARTVSERLALDTG